MRTGHGQVSSRQRSAPRFPRGAERCRILLALCALSIAVGCSSPDPWEREDPTDALKYFLSAMKYGDTETVWEFLNAEDRAVLERQAEALTERTEGAVERPAHAFLSAGHVVSSPVDYAEIRLDESASSEDDAVVVVALHDEREVRFEMTRNDGRWTVDLPLESVALGTDAEPDDGETP